MARGHLIGGRGSKDLGSGSLLYVFVEGRWQRMHSQHSCLALEPWGSGPWVGSPLAPHTSTSTIPPTPGPVRESVSMCPIFRWSSPLVSTSLVCQAFTWGFGGLSKAPGENPGPTLSPAPSAAGSVLGAASHCYALVDSS